MSQSKPPIIGTAIMAWGDAFAATKAMPLVVGRALVIVIFLSLATFWIIPDPHAFAVSRWLPVYSIISSIVYALLLAPLAIIVHRYVLLGEVANRYPLDPFSARYVRFAVFAVLVRILWSVPTIIGGFLGGEEEETAVLALLGLTVLVLFIAVVIVTVRRVILFPAIAIDAPGATWRNARRDTKGSSWRVVFILFCTALPAIILRGLLGYALLKPGFGGNHRLIFSLLVPILEIPTLCAFAAAASRIWTFTFTTALPYRPKPSSSASSTSTCAAAASTSWNTSS